jgi:dTDP-4-amino-4,6-dideoxygalactose transaminase
MIFNWRRKNFVGKESDGMNKIGVGYASVTELEEQYVLDALRNGRLSQGKYVAEFEKLFARMHDQKYGIMCNSGTSALHLALEALRETDGWTDETEVLVPAITFIATSNAVMHARMRPVFVDVDSMTYNMDPREIEKHVTPNTKCIIPVHCFGQPCDMDSIVDIAKKYNLRILEDCAESHFAEYHGRVIGSFSDIMASSTYVAHTITTGIGGVVCTSDAQLMEIVRSLLAHGRACTCERCIASDANKVCPKRMESDLDRRFTFIRLGYSYRVGELEGALGLAQLQRKDEIMDRRHSNAAQLSSGLEQFSEYLQLPFVSDNVEHSFMMYPIVIKKSAPFSRNDLVRFLEKNNIETRPMLPLLNQPIYKKIFGNIEDSYPVAKWIDSHGFYIGCHHGMTESDIKEVLVVFSQYFMDQKFSEQL